MYGLYIVNIRSYATLIVDELHFLQYVRCYRVIEKLKVYKMKQWGNSGVQKN